MLLDATLAALQQWFGHKEFLDHQRDIVEQMLEGRDLCVVMPTGAGKSLCYQLPILMRDGYGLIVSPLISLMKDQVDALRRKNIPAAFINTTISTQEQYAILSGVEQGKVKLLYVAPERFQAPGFRDFLRRMPPTSLIVDEAHCISQWGHDFRPSYLKIGDAAEELCLPQVCAFTATATRRVQEDIIRQLGRSGMELVVAGFKRPNLSFSVIPSAAGNGSSEQKWRQLEKLLERKVPTIVYASTRKAVEQLRDRFDCIAYHAGLSDGERSEAQERFMTEPTPVLAATNAFGMGIDRADVRRVIHFNIPASLEAYYQEAGRAGRDGEPAECILMYSPGDKFTHQFLIDMSNPPPKLILGVYRILKQQAQTQHSATIELTAADIEARIPDAKSPSQVSAALSMLEEYGILSRSYARSSYVILNFLQPNAALMQAHAEEKTQRSRFIHRFLQHVGYAHAAQRIRYAVSLLSEITCLPAENIKRILQALNGEVLLYEVPETREAVITLTDPNREKLDIDFRVVEAKRELELGRLDDMIHYANTTLCRQAYLIRYFGENANNWGCGICDRCTGVSAALRSLAPHEHQTVDCLLVAIHKFHGRIGRGRISRILAGVIDPDGGNSRWEDNPFFGLLKPMKQPEILNYIRALESQGFLETTGDPKYPCIDVTAAGIRQIREKADIKLALPEEIHRSAKKRRR